MTNTMIDRLRRWFTYERDVHRMVWSSFETVPAEGRGDPEYQKALDLFDHLLAARALWLHRLGVSDTGPVEPFSAGKSLDELASRLEATETAWEAYLQELDDAGLEASFTYGAWEGGRFRSSIEDILVQLFGHSWYHRGQIAQTVRRLGGEPVVTDFVCWAREPVDK